MAALSCTATMETQPQHDGVTVRAMAEAHFDLPSSDAVGSVASSSCPEHCVTTPGDAEKKKETQRQAWFENVAKKKLKIPNSYIQVAPLIIRWARDLDEYYDGHTSEVKKLKQVFNNFGFSSSSEVYLSAEKTQHTLNAAITSHIEANDGPNKLLIIYYTGHGILGEDNLLQLAAIGDEEGKASAYWYKAEVPLLDGEVMQADVLTIFDCCYASNAQKTCDESQRIYDLLAACPEGKTTPAPGKGSFTQRLVDTLNRLLKEEASQHILTTRLMEEMNKDCRLPVKLHDRLHKDAHESRHVQLVRINSKTIKMTQKDVAEYKKKKVEDARVTLNFSLYNPDMPQLTIEKWAQQLVSASERAGVPLRRIDWVCLKKNKPGERLQSIVDKITDTCPAQNSSQRLRRAIGKVIKVNRSAPNGVHSTEERSTPKKRSRSREPSNSTPKRQASDRLTANGNRSSPRFPTPESNVGN